MNEMEMSRFHTSNDYLYRWKWVTCVVSVPFIQLIKQSQNQIDPRMRWQNSTIFTQHHV